MASSTPWSENSFTARRPRPVSSPLQRSRNPRSARHASPCSALSDALNTGSTLFTNTSSSGRPDRWWASSAARSSYRVPDGWGAPSGPMSGLPSRDQNRHSTRSKSPTSGIWDW